MNQDKDRNEVCAIDSLSVLKCKNKGIGEKHSNSNTIPADNLKTNGKDSNSENVDNSEKDEKETLSSFNFELVKTFAIKAEHKPWISSIRVLQNGNVIMADFNNSKLYIYNQAIKRQKAIDLPGNPCCVAVIESDRVAVTLQSHKTVLLVDTLSGKNKKCVNVNDLSHGIAYNDGRLIVNCLEDGIKIIDLTGTVLRTLPDIVGEACICVSEEGNFYCCVYWSHKIVGFNKHGDHIYSFSKVSMKCPRGITVTANGFVFTCELGKNKVRCINPEGTKSQVVLNEKHGINNPLCAAFDNKNLYVSNNDGESLTVFTLLTP